IGVVQICLPVRMLAGRTESRLRTRRGNDPDRLPGQPSADCFGLGADNERMGGLRRKRITSDLLTALSCQPDREPRQCVTPMAGKDTFRRPGLCGQHHRHRGAVGIIVEGCAGWPDPSRVLVYDKVPRRDTSPEVSLIKYRRVITVFGSGPALHGRASPTPA